MLSVYCLLAAFNPAIYILLGVWKSNGSFTYTAYSNVHILNPTMLSVFCFLFGNQMLSVYYLLAALNPEIYIHNIQQCTYYLVFGYSNVHTKQNILIPALVNYIQHSILQHTTQHYTHG